MSSVGVGPGSVALRPLGGGGGPVVPYTTGAVAFDAATWLINAAANAADCQAISFSAWLWTTYIAPPGFQGVPWAIDPLDSYTYAATSVEGAAYPQNSPAGGYQQTCFGPGEIDYSEGDSGDKVIADGSWHHVLTSFDTSATDKWAIYIDRVRHLPSNTSFSHGTPFTMPVNGKPIWIGNDPYHDPFNGNIADLWLAPGVSLLDGTGAIPEATIAKFNSGGKPADLGADGSSPTGVSPAVFLRLAPGAAPSTFATNRGTAGAFAITGALTTSPSSPSD